MKQGSQSESHLDGLRESVSVLMDGEAQELELRRVLADEHRDVVNDSWCRYHLVRDVLAQQDATSRFSHLDISARVSAAIAEQPELAARAQRWWLKPAAGFAVAASVAAAVVVGVQGTGGDINAVESVNTLATSRVYPQSGGSLQASTGQQAVMASNLAPRPTAGAAPAPVLNTAEQQKQLDKYLLRHTQQAALNNGQGMISFARVASFETE